MGYFWEHITVGQMGKLLLDFEQDKVNKGWSNFISTIETHDVNVWKSGGRVQNHIIDSRAKFAEAYFLTFVAAICEMGGANQNLDLDILDRQYHLDQTVGPKSHLSYYLREVVAYHATANEDSAKCLERIQGYLTTTDWNKINTRTTLSVLLERIKESNKKAFKSRPIEEQYLEDSIASFVKLMNECDKIWEEMCGQCASVPDSELFRTICDLLRNGVKQIILTGAPGTGKTYLAEWIARSMGAYLNEQQEQGPYIMVPFHPSYDYTDFVEGLRPVRREGDDRTPDFVKLDGHFKKFCRLVVEKNKDDVNYEEKMYFFLIDEINRADLSKVFGELITCLESDKRGKGHGVQTQYQNLPTYGLDREDVFAEGFYVPENVYIIGTMNDIDRSVESMDFALRRRFTWLEVKVDEDLLKSAFRSGKFGDLLRDKAEDAAARIMALNAVIREQGKDFGLNEQYYISQGQFSGLPEKNGASLDGLFQFVWNYRVQSLLREYIRGVDEKEAENFLKECRKGFGVEAENTAFLPRSVGQQKG